MILQSLSFGLPKKPRIRNVIPCFPPIEEKNTWSRWDLFDNFLKIYNFFIISFLVLSF
jgi:hypothetical protein